MAARSARQRPRPGLPRRAQTAVLVALLSVLSLSEVILGFAVSTLLSQTAGLGNLLAALGLTEAPGADWRKFCMHQRVNDSAPPRLAQLPILRERCG